MIGATIEALGEGAWLLRLGVDTDADSNRRVHALATRLREASPPWLADIVPAYASLAVTLRDSTACSREQARDWLRAALASAAHAAVPERGCEVEIPVSYGAAHGVDLEPAAQALGMSPEALIARHVAPRYQVAMIGFAPGFPYLIGLDPALQLARHPRPRQRVPAGSVGIGGSQTGIYPGAGAGGWQLLGRTPLRLFDASREPASLLRPGDRVRLVRIDAADFERRRREPGGLDAD